ncbi:MAG TPA: D-alanine--D-alanine ligase family protein [Anaerolineales bacterium]|nr:D-alanine--D-alanine ligase family protein [Anaerolineales bacterium]
MPKVRVGVMFGGRSGEHEVSLMSAASILSRLDRGKYDIVEIGITHQGQWIVGEGVLELLKQRASGGRRAVFFPEPGSSGLWGYEAAGDPKEIVLHLADRIDILFPILHGTFGEDGTLQGLLEMAEMPYVGAGVLASSVAMDKGLFKDLMRACSIPVPEYALVLRRDIERDMEGVVRKAEAVSSYPLFTKPANLGSSVGVSRCANRSDLSEGLLDAARYDRRVLIERGINAREIEVSVLGNDDPRASLPGEVIPSRDFYSYESKYIDDSSRLIIPAPLAPEKTREAQELAVRVCKAIDCAGMARVDFLLDRESQALWVNEANTLPGFTQISMYPKLWEATGIPYPQLLDKLIELGFQRHAENVRNERSYESASPASKR